MVKVLIFFAFVAMFLSNFPGVSIFFQVLGVSLITLASLAALLLKQAKKTEVSPGEYLFAAAILTSMCSAIITNNAFAFTMTIVGGATLLSLSILRRSCSIETIFDLCAQSYAVMILVVLLSDPFAYLAGISGQHLAGVGLQRFRPLGLHPNLTGFIFGFGALILYFLAKNSRGFKRRIYILSAVMSITFILAASARAGLVALAGAAIITAVLGTRMALRRRTLRNIIIGGIVCCVIGVPLFIQFVFPEMVQYLTAVLDIESKTRGIGSGGTGRFDLWLLSVLEIKERNIFSILFGTGFRSSSVGQIGYSTESSYFTILLENGVIFFVIFFMVVLPKVLNSVWRGCCQYNTKLMIVALVIFVLIQSLFNRYLIAFGNPASIVALLIFLGANPKGIGRYRR
jgi:exopolysaccharide production protein ExoQ